MRRESCYHPVTQEIAVGLQSIVGAKNIIFKDVERMQGYSHDEVADPEYAHMPEVVVKPHSAQEISQIMKLANAYRIPVTPRGGGTGLSCGAVPVYGGIILSLERMNRILEIDKKNMVVVVEPGVVTHEISAAVQEQGFFYAGYPMSFESCFIGGNVAENAGGGRAIKYGVTGHYVIGLEAVLPTGEIVEMGGRRLKDVTGYDLIHLMVGSEGTLGIFSKIILRLLPLPTATAVLLIPFGDTAAAIAAFPDVIARAGFLPSSIEFMDRLSVETVYTFLGETPPRSDIGAMLLIEVDGTSKEKVESDCQRIGEEFLKSGALDVYIGDTPTIERKMWNPRLKLAEAFKAICPVQALEDIVVPTARIPDLIKELERLSQKYDVLIPCYGHAGDGNLHATPVKKPETPLSVWKEKLPLLLTELYQTTFHLGGTISGEHGIGSKRAPYLSLVMSSDLILLQKRIKQAFDPLNILNPGKIFDSQMQRE
ncbi:MAG TPA: FAD-linked oxidase C-terminal domain-containing protein [Thermodesulfobacteriota bacterium]|nr:FAD-binding protein [Deltaproteobacteria bacterium]HNR12510.1 FAD-linked oxidase C-terminal domain-containing protein [Thermodesulfobacteriota bacterium]HNU71357.1 FAD-linked oxidase C-terminal domain-containing protein [Thermodesulfobacteriota bacterium]HOC38775.1 FAD-linked oxidase C-terminal domain-containing protein [Thermodesulfobacteriota bacterium]HQO78186.1 FAD-linked oxidase C-terminal domain-containing protein [Thermodesulfobacteriota bacterium]